MTHQIIRTPEELEALDPHTVIETVDRKLVTASFARRWSYHHLHFPAVVLVPGEQAQAARKALEDA